MCVLQVSWIVNIHCQGHCNVLFALSLIFTLQIRIPANNPIHLGSHMTSTRDCLFVSNISLPPFCFLFPFIHLLSARTTIAFSSLCSCLRTESRFNTQYFPNSTYQSSQAERWRPGLLESSTDRTVIWRTRSLSRISNVTCNQDMEMTTKQSSSRRRVIWRRA